MEKFHPCQMPLQRFDESTGEHSDAVLRAFAIAHSDLMVGKIDILHPQAHAFQETQASPIEQTGHQVGEGVSKVLICYPRYEDERQRNSNTRECSHGSSSTSLLLLSRHGYCAPWL